MPDKATIPGFNQEMDGAFPPHGGGAISWSLALREPGLRGLRRVALADPFPL